MDMGNSKECVGSGFCNSLLVYLTKEMILLLLNEMIAFSTMLFWLRYWEPHTVQEMTKRRTIKLKLVTH